MKILRNGLLLAAASTALVACGGGGSDGVLTPPPGADVRDVVAVGPISNFGSVIVNGVRYNTDNATFTVNGAPGLQSDLRVGHIVAVKGSVDSNGTTGTATEVIYDDTVEGPVQDIDLAAQTLVVLGQLVRVTAETSFDDDFSPASLDGISIGDVVEVSGQFDANGDIVASRIEREDDNDEYEVYGEIANLDTAAMTFTIGSLVVDYSMAMLEDFDGGMPANGDFVEAEGTMLGPNGELIATEVERKNRLPEMDDDDELEVEGYITRFVSPEDFDVGGLPVTTTASTRYEGGTADDLGLNVKVEVEGRLNADGVLVASEVDIRRAKAVRIEAAVDAVDATGGTVTLLGIPVRVDAMTRMEDKSDSDMERLVLESINVGDFLEVRGSELPAGSGEVLAARLEKEDPDEDTVLQGFVENISQPTFEILGVTIETDSRTEFEDRNDLRISADAFFASLTDNTLIKVKGVEVADTTILAREVEFEDDDDFDDDSDDD